jgi:DNA polymerase-3 subunit beta
MKLLCEKTDLVNIVNIVQKAVPTKTTYPMLEGILVKADEKLVLMGNDLEIGIECTMDAQIYEKGEVVVDARIFGEIIKRMPNHQVSIEKVENENIIITCKKSRFEINGMDSENFPRIPEINGDKSIKISQSHIKNMINQTIFAVGDDESHPVLKGVNIETKDNILNFVAIDGFRLALRKNLFEDIDTNINVVVPRKTLSEIAKILEHVEEDVNINVSENQIMFDTGNTKVVSRLLEGEYFNYENVIPDEYETRIVINKKELLNSIERASILILGEETKYPINILLKQDKMLITANTNKGNAREEIDVEIKGNDIEVKFNPRYFIEALREINEEYVDVSFSSDVGPCVIKSIDKDTFVYMLLPLRK